MATRLGATFVPGRDNDGYSMPELVSPSPQRVTPQVPQNMQDDLQRLELEARRHTDLDICTNIPETRRDSFGSGSGSGSGSGLGLGLGPTTPSRPDPGRAPKIPDKIPQLSSLEADIRAHLHLDDAGAQPSPRHHPQYLPHQHLHHHQQQHQQQRPGPSSSPSPPSPPSSPTPSFSLPYPPSASASPPTSSPPLPLPLGDQRRHQQHHLSLVENDDHNDHDDNRQHRQRLSSDSSSSSRSRYLSNMDEPSFSPFPKIKGDNIPPADDEKEKILWKARDHVLHSQNISMQITWARDVLIWAEISTDAAIRDAADKGIARPPTPRIEHELRVDALNIIKHLASQEHPDALYIRSKWFEFGKFGERMDKREAFAGYKLAAELGNARSQYRMGMLFEQSNDMSKAKEHYYRGLSLRDSAAQYRMGMISLLGQHGEAKDYQGGLERIRNAAEGADEDAPQGAYVYGMLIARDLPDISVPEGLLSLSIDAAKMYIEKAAYLGFAKAQLKMGQAYELCQLGCDFNPSFSLHYYGLAAKQGIPEAALGVSRWFLFGYEGVFKKNEELAFAYALEAAKAKLPTGEFAMGYYHEIGIHVNKNIPEARRWYQLAADHGNHDAVGRLDSLSQDRSLSKQDHETTTHGRIKSQHGSQRGKRPDRFANKPQSQMPTLSEGSGPPTPSNDGGFLGAPTNPSGQSPRMSPLPSPGMRPTIITENTSFPDPSRASFVSSGSTGSTSGSGPPYNIRLDTEGFGQPFGAVPYPLDERPQPLNVRPKPGAPYPDDDLNQRPNYPPHGGPGPHADRAGSAFGINTQGGPRMPPGQSSGNNLYPSQNGPNAAGRGRAASAGWDPNGPGAGGGGPQGNGNRPTTGHSDKSRMQQGGRGYGGGPPPNGSHPHGGIPPAGSDPYRNAQRPGGQPGPGGPGPQGPSQAPGSAPRPLATRTATAPIGQAPVPSTSPRPSTATAPAKAGKGPATFEDMGIPQGKQDGECVIM